jgi:hypothetical protein
MPACKPTIARNRNALLLAAVSALALCLSSSAQADLVSTNAVDSTNAAPPLDAKRLYALGAIETGNNDREVGAAGEISRFQISPAVWKNYSESTAYQDPKVAETVVRLHWNFLAKYFTEKTGRAPDDFDMYVLWNTRHGYYARKQFSPQLLSPAVRDRAQRFVNLVNCKD